jgi:hypothetical protein
MIGLDLAARYARPTADLVAAEVSRRQQARLRAAAAPRPTARTWTPSRWRHVPLAELFAQAGCCVYVRGNGRLETSHPTHGGKSGRSLEADPTAGRWWCRGCRRSGDAATWLMDLHGWGYRQAAGWLADRYGRPAASPGRRCWQPLEA